MTTPNNAGPSAFPGGSGDRAFARIDTTRRDPAMDAVLSKMVRSVDGGMAGNNSMSRPLRAPDQALLQKISDITTGNINDAASLFQLLPDTELAMQILVSSIISPKDMVATELNFAVDQSQFNSELAGELLEVVRDYFQSVYKIDELLPIILQDALFLKGSYPMLVLPETSIDDAINSPARVSVEALNDDLDPGTHLPRHLGLLGMPRATDAAASQKEAFGFEGLRGGLDDYMRSMPSYNPTVSPLKKVDSVRGFDPLMTVVDNLNVLKLPILQDKIRQDRLQDVLGMRNLGLQLKRDMISNESGQTTGQQSLYRPRRYKAMPIAAINPPSHLKRQSVGHPLVMALPAECVIPVHVPSNPQEHLGYFILLDQQGNPLVKAHEQDYYNNMSANMSQDMVGSMIQKTAQASTGNMMYGQIYSARQVEIDEMERTYSDLVEAELNNRLRNGVYGANVAVSKPEEVYRIMLARALAKMHTQVLYVPAELMTYIAFDYNQYGVGTSLLQNSKILGGIRAMLLFANTMAAMKNSVGRTLLNIKLDPQDPDPSTTVEFMLHEYAKTRQGSFPLGASNPVDIISFLQNASVEVAVSGNSAYPETALEVEDKQSNRAKPDPELEKSLRDRYLMSIGVSPETVDAGANAEFATSVIANNLLMTKRVALYQKTLVAFLNEFIQKYTINSGSLLDALRKLVEGNLDKLNEEQKAAKKAADDQRDGDEVVVAAESETRAEESIGTDQLIMEFIQAVRVSLPAPDTATLDKQMEAYDKYSESLDKTLKAYLDPSFLEATSMGEMAPYMDQVIATVRAHYLRQWLRNNNVMAELDMLTAFNDKDGGELDILKITETHVEGLQHSILEYVKTLAAARKKVDAQVVAVVGDPPAPGGDTALGGDTDGFDLDGGLETPEIATDADLDATADADADVSVDVDASADADANADAAEVEVKSDEDASADASTDSKDEDAPTGELEATVAVEVIQSTESYARPEFFPPMPR